MTVLSRGARVRRGGRRPGWALLTALLVLAIGASSALVFTNRVELLKLAVILALWAAVSGAFVSMLYRRQSDADQARVRDLKLVYDLQLDREVSARREYELTVESQLRRELAAEVQAQAADDVAALRAELAALRTHLEVLFDASFEPRPALGADANNPRAIGGRDEGALPPGRVFSDRIRTVPADATGEAPAPVEAPGRGDDSGIINVPEVRPEAPPLQPVTEHMRESRPEPLREPTHSRERVRLEQETRPPSPPPYAAPPVPPSRPWISVGPEETESAQPMSGPRRARYADQDQPAGPAESTREYGGSGRRARSRHAVEDRDWLPAGEVGQNENGSGQPPAPPRLAPPPPAEPAARRHDADQPPEAPAGESVAELLARLRAESPQGGRRRRREGHHAD